MKKIEVLPYDPAWPKQFKKEKKIILDCLGTSCLQIEHIGSTSIKDMPAKCDLDILLVIDDLAKADKLVEVGYDSRGEFNIPLRYFFSKNNEESKVNLHVCEKDHGFVPLQLCFRDYLRAHPDRAKEYAELKYEILKRTDAGKRHRGWISTYGIYKNEFIKETLRRAGFKDLIINFCMHDDEIEAVKFLRKNDQFEWNWENKNHIHIVLYRGADVIGCAHLEMIDGRPQVLEDFFDHASDKEKAQFDDWINRWIKLRFFKS
ncbi:MAG: hypothetical protein S4CHLAM20_11530 [Chlamydiia bacterium]|nr:hypothetical protein [Chlamydiia bacterium]